jgi:hypothetical protein
MLNNIRVICLLILNIRLGTPRFNTLNSNKIRINPYLKESSKANQSNQLINNKYLLKWLLGWQTTDTKRTLAHAY